MKSFEFKVGRETYLFEDGDIFMDNGAIIQWIPLDHTKRKTRRSGLFTWKPTVIPSRAEWQRIQPFLTMTESDAMSGIRLKIYSLKK
jgi:hypothetical protein